MSDWNCRKGTEIKRAKSSPTIAFFSLSLYFERINTPPVPCWEKSRNAAAAAALTTLCIDICTQTFDIMMRKSCLCLQCSLCRARCQDRSDPSISRACRSSSHRRMTKALNANFQSRAEILYTFIFTHERREKSNLGSIHPSIHPSSGNRSTGIEPWTTLAERSQ